MSEVLKNELFLEFRLNSGHASNKKGLQVKKKKSMTVKLWQLKRVASHDFFK